MIVVMTDDDDDDDDKKEEEEENAAVAWCTNIGSSSSLHKAKHDRFHAGPPAWIERKFTFMLRLF